MADRRLIERCVIRDIAIDKQAWNLCTLKEEDFKEGSCRKIFKFMKEIEKENRDPTDLVELAMKLEHGDSAFFQNILNGDLENHSWGVGSIKSHQNLLRKLNQQTIVTEVLGHYGSDNPELVREKIAEAMKELSEPDQENQDSMYSEIYKEYERLSELEGALPGISSGYSNLDNRIYGFQPGEMYIIAARPSMGKSAFALNIAKNAAQSGKNILLFALEETKKNIIKRLTAMIARIHIHKLMLGKIEKHEWPEIIQAHDKISKLPLTIDDESGMKSQEIARRIKVANQKEKVDLVIVDHLQEIYDEDQNRHLAISQSLNNLKSTTKNLGIPLILLSQINRAVEMRTSKQPILSDLKESGDIEAKADCVMLLYREAYYNNECNGDDMIVSVAKARNGICGNVNLQFNGAIMTVKE